MHLWQLIVNAVFVVCCYGLSLGSWPRIERMQFDLPVGREQYDPDVSFCAVVSGHVSTAFGPLSHISLARSCHS